MFLYILLALVILLSMIAIHELGHYVVGRIFGFKINEFAIGMGPALLRKRMKNGEHFSIRVLPLGGFCSFYDGEEEGREEEKELIKPVDPFENRNEEKNISAHSHSNVTTSSLSTSHSPLSQKTPLKFNEHKPYKRILVLLGGAVFNFLSAIVFSFIFILVIGSQTMSVYSLMENQDGVYFNENLRAGDRIVAVDGRRINMLNTFHSRVGRIDLGDEMIFTVVREGYEQDVLVTVRNIQTFNSEGELIHEFNGFGFNPQAGSERVGFFRALLYSVPFTFQISWQILVVLGNLITGQLPVTALSGPVGIVSGIAMTAADNNARDLLMLLPFIASNLAIVNLLPLPALDGSKIIFTGIEWARKKPMKKKVETIIHLVGIVALLGLMLILTFFDVARLL